jgi:hypothetical protein
MYGHAIKVRKSFLIALNRDPVVLDDCIIVKRLWFLSFINIPLSLCGISFYTLQHCIKRYNYIKSNSISCYLNVDRGIIFFKVCHYSGVVCSRIQGICIRAELFFHPFFYCTFIKIKIVTVKVTAYFPALN